MPLNAQQKAAVEYLEGPLLVLAGPGTGKTQLLSAKVAYILQNIDTNPENILCLTFTEAGAENMRARLQSMIGKAALDVNIYTYHAFGANILERYKSYAENFNRKMDAPIDETMQFKIISQIQKSLPVMDILRESGTKDIISTIGSAKAARLTAADLQKIAEQNIQDSIEISAAVTPLLLELKPREKFDVAVQNVYRPILEQLLKYSSDQPIVGNVERIANILAKDLNKVITDAETQEKPKVSDLTKWKTANFEVYVADPKHLEDKRYRLKDYIANKKLASLANIMRKYEEALNTAGLFDFNDMIESAIQYLKEDDGFRMQMSEIFQYILLDEFQDTNASQFELIKLLTQYDQPVIMAVGDDDQAIFEFQGANASNLRDFQEHYNAKVITLLDNYRSTGEILGLSRKLAEQIEDSFAKNYQIDKTLTAVKDQTNGRKIAPQVTRHEFPGTVAEYYWIAQEIRKLVDQGEDPSEVAIIAPKHKNIAPILPYLKAQNLDVTYEKRDNILLDPKIHAIIELAKFVQRLANREQPVEKLLEILSYDFWQIPAEMAVCAVEKKWDTNQSVLDYLAGDVKLEKISQLLAALATVAATTPLELWLDYLLGNAKVDGEIDSPMLEFYQKHCSEAELLEFYENLNTLRQKVLQHLQSANSENTEYLPKLADFVDAMNDYEAAQTEVMRISIYRDSDNAVQVMTSHKSKGLEFKYVFLTSVDDAAWGKSKGNNNKLSLPGNLAFIRHTGITDDEQLRLFFVAITRAKEYLIMTSSAHKDDGSDNIRLRYLSESSRDETEQISPYLRAKAQTIITHNDLDTAEKIETMRLGWIGAYQKLVPDVLNLLKERMKDYRLSASDLTNFIDVIYGGPQTVYQSRILRSPSEPANFAMCYGSLIHTVFEQVTSQGIGETAAIELFKREVKKAILPEAEKQDLLEKGEQSLQIALSDFGEILRHAHAKAEVNFAPERLIVNDVPVSGKIDHLEIDPDQKTIEIYDFKTGNYHAEKWNSHPTLYKYRLQLGFYKLLVNHSLNYRNYHVTRGHILFVTPDNDGKVYDKAYDFNEADEQELKSLMRAVYRQMTSLEFLGDDELFIEADKSKTMKKMREFVQLLLEKSGVE